MFFKKKPIKIIINEAIAASTCALSSSGVIVCIEKKFFFTVHLLNLTIVQLMNIIMKNDQNYLNLLGMRY